MVHLDEGVGGALRLRAMSKMEGSTRICALRGRIVRFFKMRCARGSELNGEEVRSQGCRGK